MSQGQVIDIMTYNSYSLQYYSFRKGKIGFTRTVPVSWITPIHTKRYNITVSKNDFLRYSYSITVLRNGIFLVASQEIICNSGRQQTKSLTKILDENALEYLASRKGFILDRLRLDILTIIFTRIFNYNLSVISVCSVDFF